VSCGTEPSGRRDRSQRPAGGGAIARACCRAQSQVVGQSMIVKTREWRTWQSTFSSHPVTKPTTASGQFPLSPSEQILMIAVDFGLPESRRALV
jgi:hypothetical protein